MDGKIIWTKEGLKSKIEILTYWKNRNKSNIYPKKLNLLINKALKALLKNPGFGRPTKLEIIKFIIVKDYSIFYKYDSSNNINVVLVWDDRRDPNSLEFPK